MKHLLAKLFRPSFTPANVPQSKKRQRRVDNDRPVHYIHLRNCHVVNGATIAYRENDRGGVDVAVAICDPRNNFDREFGRIRATGRLQSRRWCHVSYMTFDEFKNWVHTTPNVEQHIKTLPTYVDLEFI